MAETLQVAQSIAKPPDQSASYIEELVKRAKRHLDGVGPARNPAKAVILLQEAVRAGDVQAMHLLADLYAAGDGVEANFGQARVLLEAAIAAGDTKNGSRALGDLYQRTDLAHRDLAMAEASYEKAIELGDPQAMLALATMLTSGNIISENFNRARDLFELAIENGEPVEGSRALGNLYRRAASPNRNPEKAQEQFRRAIDIGDAWSMLALADMLASGDGVAVDFVGARQLLDRAVAAGLTKEGSKAIGDLYRTASGANRDLTRAEEAYQAAVELGDTEAMISLAKLLAENGTSPQDFARARALLESAIAGGNERDGSRALGDFYRSRDSKSGDPVKALKAYENAIEAGDSWAKLTLASMLAKGEGIPVDFDRARSLLEQAVADGLVTDGSRALGDLYREALAPYRNPSMAVVAYNRAVDLGDSWSMISLAEMLANGDGIAVDFKRAQELLERAIAGGQVVEGSRAMGNLYRRAAGTDRDPVKAAASFQRAVDLGDSWSMLALADMYAAGDGVESDVDHARSLLEGAIAAGNVGVGARALGDLYRNTKGAHRNPVKAAEFYQMSIDAGETGAMLSFAGMIAQGDGIPADFDRARELFELAIASGEQRDGSRALGDLYRTASADHRDPVKAALAYQAAADLGDPQAMLSLAQMLGKGDGLPTDFNRALDLLDKAASAGAKADASRVLGDLFRTADEKHRDRARAAEAYQAAADLGDPWAMIALANMLSKGDGIPVNFGKARQLLEGAIAGGLEKDGSRELGDLYRKAAVIDRDLRKAEEAYQRAADLGDPWAMIALADQVASGDGVEADFDRARTLLESAVSSGAPLEGSMALGDLYLRADPANRDPAKAREAYDRAADLGGSYAMIALANIYRLGDGVPVDYERARSQLERAVSSGNARDAGKALGDLYVNMPGDGKDLKKAKESYELAAQAGNSDADLALGLLLLEIRDPRNYESASNHFKLASKGLGAENVADAMMRMNPQSLVMAVQQFLKGTGYQGPIDGVHGQGTSAAISSYCSTQALENCDGTFVSFDLLVHLLSAS